jgi:ATP-dependent DNA helicase RecQ
MKEKKALTILQSVFGHKNFRGHQEKIISTLIEGQDCLVLMPTSAGKSICFQIPSLLREGCGVVISPLIALMKDQVDSLKEMGVRAEAINSSIPYQQVKEIEHKLRNNELDLLYVAPERLLSGPFFSFLKSLKVSLFAIDEAHCISQWGHDFRPEYLKLSLLRDEFPDVPVVALTATADGPTRREILSKLNLPPEQVFLSSFDRPNISYTIVEKNSGRSQLMAFLRKSRGESGIIYCMSRKKVEEMAKWLKGQGLDALAYHAGLDEKERQRNQEYFIREESVVMVATVAFGMGIDKPNVRFVAHMDLPKSMEAYYQETGRAGRDGLPSRAWMAYGLDNLVFLRKMIESSEADEERKSLEKRKLDSLLGYCETVKCRRQVLLSYFGEEYSRPCQNCDNCLHPKKSWDGTLLAQKALSAVFWVKQRFGVYHLAQVLRGEKTEKALQFGHQDLSVFGIGQDVSLNDWRGLFRQLIAGNYLRVDADQFGAIKLTEKSGDILKGKEKIFFREFEKKVKGQSAKGTKSGGGNPFKQRPDFQDDFQSKLFEDLRNYRLKLSRERGVAPYHIFIDKTLVQMAELRPQSLKEMRELHGVGNFKLRRYGKLFVDFLREA